MKTNREIKLAMFAAFVIAAAAFTACKKEPPTSAGGPPTYNMYMTDAPADYQQVNVNIIGAEANTTSGGWVALNVKAGIYNLITLGNGKDTLIATGQLNASTVTQVRLLLGTTGNTVMVNNTLYTLQTPSADQSGLTVNVSSNMSGTSNSIVLDFDAGMSVVANGSGSYILKPVIRANIAPDNGSIQGTVSVLSPATVVLAINGSDTASGFTSLLSGGFMVQGLASGTYDVVLIPPPPYTITTVAGVSVTSGQVTSMGTITLQQ